MKASLLEKLPKLPEGFFWRIERAPSQGFWLGVYEAGSEFVYTYGSILDWTGGGTGSVNAAEVLTDELVVATGVKLLELFEEKRERLRKMEEKRVALEALEEAKKASLEYLGDYIREGWSKPLVEKWEKVRAADLVTGDLVRIVSAGSWVRRGPWVVEVGEDLSGYAYAFDVNDPGRNRIYDSQLVFGGEWLERPVKSLVVDGAITQRSLAEWWVQVGPRKLVVGDEVKVEYVGYTPMVRKGRVTGVGQGEEGVRYIKVTFDNGMKVHIAADNFWKRKFFRKTSSGK